MKFKIYDYENDRSVDIELTASQWKELQTFLKELKNPPAQDYKAVLDIYCCPLCATKLYQEVTANE